MANVPCPPGMRAAVVAQAAPGSIVMPDWRMGRSIPVPKADCPFPSYLHPMGFDPKPWSVFDVFIRDKCAIPKHGP